jgi:hypothetical protein
VGESQEADIMKVFLDSSFGREHVVQLLEYDDGSDLNLPPIIFMDLIDGVTLYQHHLTMKKVES